MEEKKKIKLIGFGNKGRHGKDTLADLLKVKLEGSVVMHFADPLKEEVSYVGVQPLIFRKFYNGKIFYYLRDHVNTYITKTAEDMPLLHKIFTERQINEYWHMAEKDPEILQVWGTDFRRMQNPQYWVQKIERMIINMEFSKTDQTEYILLPDTRFVNEHEFIKSKEGIYIKVLRLNEDGSTFIDPRRSPTHPSETELDHVDADLVIKAKSGDLKKLENSVEEILELLK
jgi:hypothetical protein